MIRRGITTAVIAASFVGAAPALAQSQAEVCADDAGAVYSDEQWDAFGCDDYNDARANDPDTPSDEPSGASEEDSGVEEGSTLGSGVQAGRGPVSGLPVITVVPGSRVRIVGGRREKGRVCVVVERVMRGDRRDRDWLRCRVRAGKVVRVQRFNVKPKGM